MFFIAPNIFKKIKNQNLTYLKNFLSWNLLLNFRFIKFSQKFFLEFFSGSKKELSNLAMSFSFFFSHSFSLPLPSHLSFLFPSARTSFHDAFIKKNLFIKISKESIFVFSFHQIVSCMFDSFFLFLVILIFHRAWQEMLKFSLQSFLLLII